MERPQAAYLELIVEHAPAGIAVFDNQMHYVYVNQLWNKLFNITENIIGKSHYEVFPTIPEHWKAYHRRGLKGEVIAKEEDFHLLINGKKVWMNWEIRPWFNDKREVAGIIILIKDITEKKLIESIRSEGERKFEAIFDQVGIGIIQTSPEGKFITANARFSGMIGYTLEELRTKTFSDITYPEDIQVSTDFAKKMLSSKENSVEFEKRYIKKDGTLFWAQLTITLLRDSEGNPSYFLSTVQDITQKKLVEQALLESQQKFQIIFDQTAMGLSAVGLDGSILNANQKFCDAIGYPLDELKKMTFQQFTHKDDLEKDLSLLQQLMKGEIETYSLEKRYIKKDGGITWAFLNVSLVRDPDGKPLYFISGIHDINKRKQYEEELKKSKEELEQRVRERTSYLTLLQTISSEANKSDNVGDALRLSLFEICKLTKWQIGHFYLIDKGQKDKIPMSDLWCLEDEDLYRPFVEKTDRIEQHDVSIINRVIKTGRPFWSNDIFNDHSLIRSNIGLQVGIKSGMAFPVLVGDEVTAVLEFFSNINIHPSPALMELMSQIGIQLGRLLERQKAKEDIELSQSRLQAVIDNLPARIYLKDRERRYLLVNKVFNEFFKINYDVKGLRASEVFPKDRVEPWGEGDDKVINEGAVVSYEITYGKDRKGRRRTFQLTKFPVADSHGKIYAFGGISIEITDLKETEEKIRSLLQSEHKARTEAEKAILARDEFISIASHELKSPITALKMKAQVILRHLNKNRDKYDESVITSLSKLDHDADRLVVLINRLLDITRIQTGHFELNREEIVVNDLIHNLIETFGLQMEASQSELQVELKGTVRAYWDKSRIEQVITNLLTNAIKFGENKPIKLILETTDHHARISVIDHGRGIAPEFMDKIFNRYERANVSEGIQGLGLGLYIVKQILDSHGGSIKVESKLGKGSTFVVELPLFPNDHIPKKPDKPQDLQLH